MGNENLKKLTAAGLLGTPTHLDADKRKIIEDFSDQEIDALISTSQKLGITTTMVEGIVGTACEACDADNVHAEVF